MVKIGIVIALELFTNLDVSNTTCRAPTTTVDVMKAQITPNASAKPNVVKGGNGEIMFARNAATVVITANESGTESFAQARNQDSAGSEYCSRRVACALCKWIA